MKKRWSVIGVCFFQGFNNGKDDCTPTGGICHFANSVCANKIDSITKYLLNRFESLTVKMTEKRIDGILEPEQESETIYFLEVRS